MAVSDEVYPLQEIGRNEELLSFSGSTEEQACIGHLRGDFGSGTEFWTTWWDHQETLKDKEFKNELDTVVDALRRDGPLKDLGSMEQFCRKHEQARMSPAAGTDYYGFRVDTPEHRYYLRFLPRRRDYNFYIYCYKADKLERAAELPSKKVAMPDYDLSTIGAISASAKLAHVRADQEPNQDSYNTAWLHGYADALSNAANALEPQRELMETIIGYLGEQHDSTELYEILHGTLAMSDKDILSLGFDMPQCREQIQHERSEQKKKRGKTHER